MKPRVRNLRWAGMNGPWSVEHGGFFAHPRLFDTWAEAIAYALTLTHTPQEKP